MSASPPQSEFHGFPMPTENSSCQGALPTLCCATVSSVTWARYARQTNLCEWVAFRLVTACPSWAGSRSWFLKQVEGPKMLPTLEHKNTSKQNLIRILNRTLIPSPIVPRRARPGEGTWKCFTSPLVLISRSLVQVKKCGHWCMGLESHRTGFKPKLPRGLCYPAKGTYSFWYNLDSAGGVETVKTSLHSVGPQGLDAITWLTYVDHTCGSG